MPKSFLSLFEAFKDMARNSETGIEEACHAYALAHHRLVIPHACSHVPQDISDPKAFLVLERKLFVVHFDPESFAGSTYGRHSAKLQCNACQWRLCETHFLPHAWASRQQICNVDDNRFRLVLALGASFITVPLFLGANFHHRRKPNDWVTKRCFRLLVSELLEYNRCGLFAVALFGFIST